MSGSGRKRSSKWDSRDQPQFDDDHIEDDGWSEKAGRPFYHREGGHGWQSPELAGSNGSKHDAVISSREPFSGSRGSHKNEKFDKEHRRYAEDAMGWDDDGDYGTRMSPGLEEWRQQSHSQSPKSGWNRRDKSRSRSRSRGRSRSPAHSLRRDSGFLDRSRSRSGVSNQLCKEFTAGRCRRGNNCSFLHDAEETYDDYWDNRHRKGSGSKYSSDTRDFAPRRSSVPCADFVKGKCRRGASCRFEHNGASDEFGKSNEGGREKENDRRRRDTSMERIVEHEFRRSSDIPCKFFAAGNCRNGKHCRFSHHNRAYSSPDRKPHDKWAVGRKSDDLQGWDSPKWSDKVSLSDAAAKVGGDIDGRNGALEPNSSNWSMNNRLRNNVNTESTTIPISAVSSEATKSNDKEALQWKADGTGTSMSLAGSRIGEKWIDDMDMSPDWNYPIPSSNQIPRRSESFKDVPLKNGKHGATEEDSGRFNSDYAVVQPMVNAIPFFQAKSEPRDNSGNVLPYEDKSAIRNIINSRADPSISGSTMSLASVNQNGQNAGVFHFPSSSTIEQSQMVIPAEPQGVILANLQNNILSPEGKSVIKPDFQANPGISLSQNLSTSNQLNLKNLQASLVHLLGNEQQFYAALSSNNATNPSFAYPEGSGFPVSSSIPKPDVAVGLNNNTLGVIPNPVMKTTVSDGKSETQLKKLIPPSLPSLSDGTQLDGSLEDSKQKAQSLISPKPNSSSEVVKGKNELGAEENKKPPEENKKAPEADPLDGVEKDGVTDGKKNKDVKGVRAFKFALVEFVKELLKPSWKDGQINKDAYKTIVKKVVDKVTATMQGANIPQTQEKIDHYLSNSKEKLTKLVQAYVGKNQKV